MHLPEVRKIRLYSNGAIGIWFKRKRTRRTETRPKRFNTDKNQTRLEGV